MSIHRDDILIKSVGLTKIYKDFWGRAKAKAVNDVDFEVRRGEVFGLLGPNGSGKSTIVKMILGLLYPSSGLLNVFGKSPKNVKNKSLIGYLPEETYLYKYLTAEETLDFFAAIFNLNSDERKKRTSQLLNMVGLSHAANRPVGEFSKGMQRRIGLAQAMINDPELLILDEPTSGLDPLGCREIKDLIRMLRDRGKTVLVTSHQLGDLQDICDRVVILYGGKIRAEGDLDDLLKEEDKLKFELPNINDEMKDKICSFIKDTLKINDADFSINHPKKSLEGFFLDVINAAKNEHTETYGVADSGEMADYLLGSNSKDELINKLLKEEKVEEKQILEIVKKPESIDKKLSEIIEEPEEIIEEISNEDFKEANQKLAQLLNKTDE